MALLSQLNFALIVVLTHIFMLLSV